MPMPFTYRHATEEWRRYLAAMQERTLIDSPNVIYTATDGIFRAFRCRVPARQVLAFGDQLPAVMRAVLTFRWDISAPLKPWVSRGELDEEIRRLRQSHNFAPPGILNDLVWGIRREVDARSFDRVLKTMAPEAREMWRYIEK